MKNDYRSWFNQSFCHFNGGELKRACVSIVDHYDAGGKIMLFIAGAMSSAELGIHIAPLIRSGKIHAISTTGANMEESIFRLIAHHHYKDYPNFRSLSTKDDVAILADGGKRVTDMSIPEDEAFEVLKPFMSKIWERATKNKEQALWHEYFLELFDDPAFQKFYQGDRDDCWLLAAKEMNIPIVVPGFEDSTFGNIFASCCQKGEVSESIVRNGIGYMRLLYEKYPLLAENGPGLGIIQIGGGISGDFPICVVPSLVYDMEQQNTKKWGYFLQISDSTTSYGSYSGAPPNEKITWGKLDATTPRYMVESDATIVFPLITAYIFNSLEY